MRLQVVAPRRGAAWLRQGLGVFVHRPLAFSALLATFLFASFILLSLPYIGPATLFASLPLVSLAFMIATQQALQGGSPNPGVFVLPLRVTKARTRALLQLGLLYTAGSVLIMLLCHWFDGGKLLALQQVISNENPKPEDVAAALQDPQLIQGLLARGLLSLLLSLPFWYAPALVHWGGHTAAKALFFSTMAVWRNRLAFLVYAATWFGSLFAFGLASSMLLTMLGLAPWAERIMFPAVLMFFTVMYASLFFSFIDSFEMAMEPADA